MLDGIMITVFCGMALLSAYMTVLVHKSRKRIDSDPPDPPKTPPKSDEPTASELVLDQLIAIKLKMEEHLSAFDTMNATMEKFTSHQMNFLRAMLGDSVIPSNDEPDEDPEVTKAIERMMRKYACTREEARERVKKMMVYQSGRGMGGNV